MLTRPNCVALSFLCALFAFSAATPGAEENAGDPDARPATRSEFLERTEIFYNLPAIGPGGTRGNVPLFFEAQLAPHLYIFNGLWRLGVRDGSRSTLVQGTACDEGGDCASHAWHFVQALSITPEVRLRMVFSTDANDNHSAPVRPPSFMPRLDYQVFFYKRPRSLPFWSSQGVRGLWLVSPSIAIGHHSNGQEHCRFDPTERTKDPDECPPWDGDLGKVNFRSGDFSTNYLIERVHVAFIEIDPYDYEIRRYVAGLVFEQNPKNMFGDSGLND